MKPSSSYAARVVAMSASIALWAFAAFGCGDDPVSPRDEGSGRQVTQLTEREFPVGDSPVVRVDGVVGSIIYRSGRPGRVEIVAVRRAETRSALDLIDVTWTHRHEGIDVAVDIPDHLKNASVDFEITAPSDAIPRLATAVGGIRYQGRPMGDCRFETGVGSIRLSLPANVSVTVDLSVGVGSISSSFDIRGTASSPFGHVRGKIGEGDGGSLVAKTGVGSIYLSHR